MRKKLYLQTYTSGFTIMNENRKINIFALQTFWVPKRMNEFGSKTLILTFNFNYNLKDMTDAAVFFS